MNPQQEQYQFGYRPPTPGHRISIIDDYDDLSTVSSVNLTELRTSSVINSEVDSCDTNNQSNPENDNNATLITVRDRIKMYNATATTVNPTSKPLRRIIPKSLVSRSNASYTSEIRNDSSNGSNQLSQKPSSTGVVENFRDVDETNKVMERCRYCNLLKRNNQVHYCFNRNNWYRFEESLGMKNNMSNISFESTNYNNCMNPNLMSKDRAQYQNGKTPLDASYDSKTTILKTSQGVRIVIDIYFDQQQHINLQNFGNRIETEMPYSRILNEFQEQMSRATSQNSSSTLS